MLELVLFNVFINDLEKGLSRETAKFSDGTKLFLVVNSQADVVELQKDLSKFE